MSLHGVAGPPVQRSPNSGNKFWIARPLTLPNFVGLWQKVWDICCMTCYGPMPIIVPNFIALNHTMYEKCVAGYVQSWSWCTAKPDLSMCQISSRSDYLCTRYLVPIFIDFGDSVTNKQTCIQKNKSLHTMQRQKKIFAAVVNVPLLCHYTALNALAVAA